MKFFKLHMKDLFQLNLCHINWFSNKVSGLFEIYENLKSMLQTNFSIVQLLYSKMKHFEWWKLVI